MDRFYVYAFFILVPASKVLWYPLWVQPDSQTSKTEHIRPDLLTGFRFKWPGPDYIKPSATCGHLFYNLTPEFYDFLPFIFF